MIKSRDCFWVVLENYGKKYPSRESNQTAYEIVRNHLTLPNNISKLRAWIRIALTKKILVQELRKAIGIVKKIDQCYYKWSITRNDALNTWLTVIESLNKIDFNLLVKESTLNLSDSLVNWSELIDSSGNLHLEIFAPYLNLDIEDNLLKIGDDSEIDKVLMRQVGFLEDENMRLRRSVLQQMNHNSRSDALIDDLAKKLGESKNYAVQLEEEVQRLQILKFELEERVSAHELTNKSLLKQFNKLNK